MQWLENEFLDGYIEEWVSEIERNTQYTASQKRKMGLSLETIQGLRITGTYSILVCGHVIMFYFNSEVICRNDSVPAIAAWWRGVVSAK